MARTAVATDDFDRAGTALGSNWTQLNSFWNSMVITNNRVRGSNANADERAAAMWAGAGTFTADQYSSLEIAAGISFQSNQYTLGVCVRASGATHSARDYYELLVEANGPGPTYTTELNKIVDGVRSSLHSAAVAWSVGDRIELEAEGTTIRAMKNGAALGGSFTQTDSDLATGTPGIAGSSAADNVIDGDNWEGGNLSAAASVGLLRRRRGG